MYKQYRKKPIVIEAVLFDGNNFKEVGEFTNHTATLQNPLSDNLIIPTLEGDHIANPGDYIIKGVQGEFYPCKPDIFAQTYEEVS